MFTEASIENTAGDLTGAVLVVRCTAKRTDTSRHPRPLLAMQSEPVAFLGLEEQRVRVSAVVDDERVGPLGYWVVDAGRSGLRGYDHVLRPRRKVVEGNAGEPVRSGWGGLFDAMSAGRDLDLVLHDGERRVGRFLLLLRGFGTRFDDLVTTCGSQGGPAAGDGDDTGAMPVTRMRISAFRFARAAGEWKRTFASCRDSDPLANDGNHHQIDRHGRRVRAGRVVPSGEPHGRRRSHGPESGIEGDSAR